MWTFICVVFTGLFTSACWWMWFNKAEQKLLEHGNYYRNLYDNLMAERSNLLAEKEVLAQNQVKLGIQIKKLNKKLKRLVVANKTTE